jgi:hypothetical protein
VLGSLWSNAVSPCDRFEGEGLARFVAGEPPDPHLDSCPDCQAALASYKRVAAALAQALEAPPRGWEAKVWAKLPEASVRPRVPWPIVLGLGATLAALAVVFVRTGGPETLALTAQLERGQRPLVRGSAPKAGEVQSAAPGDVLHLVAKVPRRKLGDLRVYRGTEELVFQCATSAACTHFQDGLEARVPLLRLGSYRVLLIAADSALPAASGNLDADYAAALRAGTATESSSIEVL